jgi:hypothetical protein
MEEKQENVNDKRTMIISIIVKKELVSYNNALAVAISLPLALFCASLSRMAVTTKGFRVACK